MLAFADIVVQKSIPDLLFQFLCTALGWWWCSIRIGHFDATLNTLHLDALKGCALSSISVVNYEQVEERLIYLTWMALKILVRLYVVCFAVSAMIPIAYLIFGFPHPDQWITVYGFR